MSFLLPSDMGRLIYGYLQSSCSEELAEEFLNTSDSMKECRKYKHIGFNAKVHDRTLTQMLDEYSLLSDLILEHSNEKERCHLNVVNTLQNLLKSRIPYPIPRICSTNTTVLESSGETNRKKSECNKEASSSHSVPRVNKVKIASTPVKTRVNDTMLEFSSPRKCSESTASNTVISVNSTPEKSVDCEASTVRNTLPRTSPLINSVSAPVQDEQPTGTANPNAVISPEPLSHFENAAMLQVSRSVSPVSIVSTNYTPSPQKSLEKSVENLHHAVISNTLPLNNMSASTFLPKSKGSSLRESIETSMSSRNMSSIPTTSVQNSAAQQKRSDKFKIAASTSIEDRSSKRESSERMKVTPLRLISTEKVWSSTLVKDSPQRKKEKKKAISSKPLTEKPSLETNPSTLQSSNPVKILPKLLPSPKEQSKNHSPSPKNHSPSTKNHSPSTKNNSPNKTNHSPSSGIKTQLHRISPCPSEPVPWDYRLRQSINDNTDGVNNHDASKESRKNRGKRDDTNEKNGRASSNKRKHEKKPIVCKKLRKLEEAKKAKVEEKMKNTPKKNLEIDGNSSTTLPIENNNVLKSVEKEIGNVPQPKLNCREDTVAECPKLDMPISNDADGEEDLGVRREVSEEIVLFYKVCADFKEVVS